MALLVLVRYFKLIGLIASTNMTKYLSRNSFIGRDGRHLVTYSVQGQIQQVLYYIEQEKKNGESTF